LVFYQLRVVALLAVVATGYQFSQWFFYHLLNLKIMKTEMKESKVKVKVVTLIVHQQVVAEALERGGYTASECRPFPGIKGVALIVEHPELPFEMDKEELKLAVLKWLHHRLGSELFFVVMSHS
jgi:hypothetical protein